ncbi:MAG TPA: phosphatidylinositol-specific phospholipase C1-like protein [Aquihabitans sp.]|nr:phosphatidylinositol-specific phospholipase C1-like protein [Aquihabitans sp.]
MRRANGAGVRRGAGAALAIALVLAACSDDGDGDAGRDERSTEAAADRPTTTEGPTRTAASPADDLRLHQLQVVGTHNSFHVAAPPEELALLTALNPEQAAQRRYSHRPLPEQLDDQQVRQLELDVFADAQGGLYAEPALRRQAGLPPLVDTVPELAEPGTKVLHEQDVDYHSVCPTLVACLTGLEAWSSANPDHVPVAVHLQLKDGPLIFPVPDQAVPEPWTAQALDGLDAEIRSVFDPDRLITPDDVRGDRSTLEEAVLDEAWPTLGESRGKVLFLLLNGEPYRARYREGHPNLEGRVLFTNAEPGQPDASFVGVDDPTEDPDRIAELVAAGYLVRTRADEPDAEARTGGTARRDAAVASGAHWISTDHPAPDGARELYGTDYVVALPGGVAARCNPVSAPDACDDAAVEPG